MDGWLPPRAPGAKPPPRFDAAPAAAPDEPAAEEPADSAGRRRRQPPHAAPPAGCRPTPPRPPRGARARDAGRARRRASPASLDRAAAAPRRPHAPAGPRRRHCGRAEPTAGVWGLVLGIVALVLLSCRSASLLPARAAVLGGRLGARPRARSADRARARAAGAPARRRGAVAGPHRRARRGRRDGRVHRPHGLRLRLRGVPRRPAARPRTAPRRRSLTSSRRGAEPLHQAVPHDCGADAGAPAGVPGDGRAGALPPRARLRRGPGATCSGSCRPSSRPGNDVLVFPPRARARWSRRSPTSCARPARAGLRRGQVRRALDRAVRGLRRRPRALRAGLGRAARPGGDRVEARRRRGRVRHAERDVDRHRARRPGDRRGRPRRRRACSSSTRCPASARPSCARTRGASTSSSPAPRRRSCARPAWPSRPSPSARSTTPRHPATIRRAATTSTGARRRRHSARSPPTPPSRPRSRSSERSTSRWT